MPPPPRPSIAGLMGIVLVVALGLVALRSGSAAWAGAAYLLTYGVLLLAVVGAACRPAAERARWLGFALFGFAYFRHDSIIGDRRVVLPTTQLLGLIRPAGVRPFDGHLSMPIDPDEPYWLVGHCLWSLVAATVGSLLAGALFAAPGPPPAAPVAPPGRAAPPGWRRAGAIGLLAVVALAALVLIGPRSGFLLWASTLYLATWALLGGALLGFACGRGRRRLVWLGAALFGLGYMTLNRRGDDFEQSSYVHTAADEFLEAARPLLPPVVRRFSAKTAAIADENARIRGLLDRKVPLRFRDGVTLQAFLDHIRAATRAADGRELPIYVDPVALQDADKTMDSIVSIDLGDGVLETTLGIALRQIFLTAYVSDGMLYITGQARSNVPAEVDSYLLAGHCVLALLAAGLGAGLVPLVAGREA